MTERLQCLLERRDVLANKLDRVRQNCLTRLPFIRQRMPSFSVVVVVCVCVCVWGGGGGGGGI